jgi:pyruvate dehydrogenase E2 component (dihydrolipoamide acetyltransferase)
MMTAMRKAISRAMSLSKQTIPHYYLTAYADMTYALQRRDEVNSGHPKDQRVSINDLVVAATARALEAHRHFNAYYQDDALAPIERINIGIAIALPAGLIAPAILDCQGLTLDELAARSRDLAARARTGKLKAGEYTAGTFTITNLGMYGISSFTAIIVPPQVAILAAGAVQEAPARSEQGLVWQQRLALTLSADHRATDGAQGAQFLADIVSVLQDPARLFEGMGQTREKIGRVQ